MNLTTLTDFALAIVTAILGVVLIRRAGGRQPVRLWGWAFVALALSGVFGGAWHGFHGHLGSGPLVWIWRFSELGIGLFGFCVIASTTHVAFTGTTRRVTLAATTLALSVYAAWTWNHDAFRYVLIWNVAVMVFVLLVFLTRLRRLAATPWILAGIAASAVAAGAQASSITLWVFDHNDLFHLIQLAAVLLLFVGALRLPAAPSTSVPDLPK